MRHVQFDRLQPQRARSPRGLRERSDHLLDVLLVHRARRRFSGRCAIAEGASGTQPPSSGAISEPPSHGARLEALRPACESWMPQRNAETERSAAITRCKPAWFSSLYRPRQPGVMRPSGLTPVASRHNSPAPEIARPPRWIRCQSPGVPPDGAVLAHRRDHDPVGQSQRPESQRREQMGSRRRRDGRGHAPRLTRSGVSPGAMVKRNGSPGQPAPWHFLYFLPLPHGQGSLRPG